MLVGWVGLLVPSLIRSIEPAFDQTDAGIGVFFFVTSASSACGALGGGFITERIGRRMVLPAGVLLIALGLAGQAAAPTWPAFLLATVPFGLGMGTVDGGSNGLILDLYPTSRGRALNLLHLFFSIGALASPLFVGRLLEAGAGWQTIILGTAVAALPIAVALAITHLPSGRHARHPAEAGRGRTEPRSSSRGRSSPWPWRSPVTWRRRSASRTGWSGSSSRPRSASRRPPLRCSGRAWRSVASLSAAWSDRFDHARFAATAAFIASIALGGCCRRAFSSGLDHPVRGLSGSHSGPSIR